MLTDAQIQQFIETNVLVLEDCFDPDVAEAWVEDACRRAGVDRDDDATWLGEHCFLGRHAGTEKQEPMSTFSPKAWEAMCQLLGGVDRIATEPMVTDAFVVNFCQGWDKPWVEPISRTSGWHVDGDFNHFVDSPENGLFYLMLFSDIDLHGGATYIAPDSPTYVLRMLLDHPEGLSAYHLRTSHCVADRCREGIPAMGKTGTVYLMYPEMLHTTSQNLLRKPRFIRNGMVPLNEPRCFDHNDPVDLSPVERCALRNLGLDRLSFAPPPDALRGATDHDTGELLAWKYGQKPSFKSEAPPRA